MATIEDAHKVRWNLAKPGIPYNHDFAIPSYWRAHPEVGSPIGPEMEIGDGASVQAFTSAVLKYEPGIGVTEVTE